jgi:hypothetical protein
MTGPLVKCPKYDHPGDRIFKSVCEKCKDKVCKEGKRLSCGVEGHALNLYRGRTSTQTDR